MCNALLNSELIILLQKIAEQDGGRYEMAVYALQCSNLKRILPICTDWEVCCLFNSFASLLNLNSLMLFFPLTSGVSLPCDVSFSLPFPSQLVGQWQNHG